MMTVKRTNTYDVDAVFKKMLYTSDGYSLPYRLYVPKNYDCGEMYPVLIYLHGAGERGSDNERQLDGSLRDMFADIECPIYDTIVIAPQCPANSQWVYTPWEKGNYSCKKVQQSRELEAVLDILDDVITNYNVDEDRVYVSGISMGGFGTWDLLSRHGSRFAAGVIACGAGDPEYAPKLKRIPIMFYHGSDDEVVPVSGARMMYAAIRKEGGENVFYTELDGTLHDIRHRVYQDKTMTQWLFSQSRYERRIKAEKKAAMKKKAIAGGAGAGAAGVITVILLSLFKKKSKKKAKKNDAD